MVNNIYIDAEWYIGGKIFLIGICNERLSTTLLHDQTLTKTNFLRTIQGATHLYFYGPDIGVIEKFFGIRLRHKFICVNLLKIFRRLHPRAAGHKLIQYERRYKIYRKTARLKSDVWGLIKLWQKPHTRELLKQYNREDVVNMARLKKIIFKRHRVRQKWLFDEKLA